MKFFLGVVECLTSSKGLDFGDDLDHDPDSGILTEFLPLRDKDYC